MKFVSLMLNRRKLIIAFCVSIATMFTKRFEKAFQLLRTSGAASASMKEETSGKKTLKAIVVYYSGTGSTAKAARGIYEGIKSIMPCDVAPIDKIDPKKMGAYDFVAFGGPIWFYREPANLRLFIYNMPRMTGKLCITFCTHGTTPHGFFYSLAQPLRKKEFTIIGWNDWYGDVLQYKHAVQPYITHGHPDEIDLREAAVFGREMAQRAIGIYNGETNLIPEIPPSPNDENLLWVQKGIMKGNMGGKASKPGTRGASPAAGPLPPGPSAPEAVADGLAAGNKTDGTDMQKAIPEGIPGADPHAMPGSETGDGPAPFPDMMGTVEIPIIDTDKCIYPRCSACMDNCIADAIDLSMAAPAGLMSDSELFVNGCLHCGFPLCQRSCAHDAITYKGDRTEYAFDMTKCTYPQCTLCVDHCPMKSIDLSKNPPVRHNNCEGCDLCWSLCPTGAIEIINMEDRMNAERLIKQLKIEIQECPQYQHYRQLLPDGEWGQEGKAWYLERRPRVALNPDDWPYSVTEI